MLVVVVLCGVCSECSDNVRLVPAAGNSSSLIASLGLDRDCGNGTMETGHQKVVQPVNGDVVRPSQVRSRQKRYVAFPEGSSFSVSAQTITLC